MVVLVKVVVQVRLLPDAEQASALEATLRTVNEAACWVSAVAFERRVFREYALRQACLRRAQGPGARLRRPPST